MTIDPGEVFRAEHGRALAAVARAVGSLDVAEDALQDAYVEALRTWPRGGVPVNPGAWIVTVARNRARDRLRRESIRGGKELAAVTVAATGPGDREVSVVPDDELRLLFTCAHPALAPDAQVALTLRLVCGLTTGEIARVLLASEPAVARKLTRAKAKVRDAAILLRLPPAHQLPERLPHVLACIYLVYTEGYSALTGPSPIRPDLCTEAVRLARLLCDLMPDEREAWALYALLLLQHSRRDARLDDTGGVVPLEDQDRSRWDGQLIREGLAALRRAGGPGRYTAEAVVAATHATADSFEHTDWTTIVAAYDRLLESTGSPAVAVARAVALGFRDGWDAGLAALDAVSSRPELQRLTEPARADLLRRAGRRTAAAAAYRRALGVTRNDAVRRFLRRRLAEVQEPGDAGAR